MAVAESAFVGYAKAAVVLPQRHGRWLLAGLAALSGCDGAHTPASTLSPAGTGADQLANLFWVMAVGATIIWFIVVGLGVYSLFKPESGSPRKAGVYIIGGGVVFPTIVLTILLVYGLSMLPGLVAPPPEGSLQIGVVGHQWWWRVRYPSQREGEFIELANEIHLPVDEPVEFHLNGADVIHAFWIPSLGGKKDMIPGRRTKLTLYPNRKGLYRGVCAEYCGGSHALMCFDVVVEEKEDFERWLERQSQPAAEPISPLAVRGKELFLANGCGACHTVRGTPAGGKIGPDLTHVGSRRSLAASTLPNDAESFFEWMQRPESVKPEAHMPLFGMLPPEDLQAMAAYLEGLQ